MTPRSEILSSTEPVSVPSEQEPQGLPSRARAQLAAFVKNGAKRLSEFDQALSSTEASRLTLTEVSRSVSSAAPLCAARRAAAARVELIRAQAKAAFEEVDRAPGRAIAALAARTRVPLRALTERLAQLEKRIDR